MRIFRLWRHRRKADFNSFREASIRPFFSARKNPLAAGKLQLCLYLPLGETRSRKRHRTRLEITRSDHPNCDRNHNPLAHPSADAELVIAEQSIFHGGTKATAVHLAVIEGTP
jgi:predicted acyl esterase